MRANDPHSRNYRPGAEGEDRRGAGRTPRVLGGGDPGVVRAGRRGFRRPAERPQRRTRPRRAGRLAHVMRPMPQIQPDPVAWNDQLLRDPHAQADKRTRVQRMFAAIAPTYDLNNRLHSLWQDQRWRRKAVKLANLKPTDVVVDVACGTGDLTIAFARDVKELRELQAPRERTSAAIVGIDFTFEMLPLARRKGHFRISGADDDGFWDGFYDGIRWLNADAQSLPLCDACCDVVSIAFGIRNVQDP